jgi:hypothetical protein
MFISIIKKVATNSQVVTRASQKDHVKVPSDFPYARWHQEEDSMCNILLDTKGGSDKIMDTN